MLRVRKRLPSVQNASLGIGYQRIGKVVNEHIGRNAVDAVLAVRRFFAPCDHFSSMRLAATFDFFQRLRLRPEVRRFHRRSHGCLVAHTNTCVWWSCRIQPRDFHADCTAIRLTKYNGSARIPKNPVPAPKNSRPQTGPRRSPKSSVPSEKRKRQSGPGLPCGNDLLANGIFR